MTIRNEARSHNKTRTKKSPKEVKAFLKERGHETLADYLKHVVTTVGNYDACIEWEFALRDDGYGQVKWGSKLCSVHRLSLEIKLNRLLTTKEEACHRCDNPRCFNPNHLFVGSKSDNMRDMVGKFRHRGFDNVPVAVRLKIRDLYTLGWNRSVLAEIYDVSTAFVYDLVSDIDINRIAQLQKESESKQ